MHATKKCYLLVKCQVIRHQKALDVESWQVYAAQQIKHDNRFFGFVFPNSFLFEFAFRCMAVFLLMKWRSCFNQNVGKYKQFSDSIKRWKFEQGKIRHWMQTCLYVKVAPRCHLLERLKKITVELFTDVKFDRLRIVLIKISRLEFVIILCFVHPNHSLDY